MIKFEIFIIILQYLIKLFFYHKFSTKNNLKPVIIKILKKPFERKQYRLCSFEQQSNQFVHDPF